MPKTGAHASAANPVSGIVDGPTGGGDGPDLCPEGRQSTA